MFSYDDYKEIIRIMKSTGFYTDYKNAIGKDKFVLMRHDVEYSVERAYLLSKVEESMDFRSTFFFQWTNNTYNILSKRNMDMIHEMHENGQNIGLHFALNGLTDLEVIKKQIVKEIDLLSEMCGFKIDTFSFHRPTKEVLRENIKLPGIINTYQDDFFTFAEEITPDTEIKVKYMSDANHIWRYGYPDEANITGNDKVQVLVHPFAWHKNGYDNFNNYVALVEEKYAQMIEGIDAECKDFGEYKEWFLDRTKLNKDE